MKDDFLTRDWAGKRGAFFVGLTALLDCIGTGLARANAYQFDAPWRRDEGRDRKC